jgi:hypothetical protein
MSAAHTHRRLPDRSRRRLKIRVSVVRFRPWRQLLVPQSRFEPCFSMGLKRLAVGEASREEWFLVSGPADPDCAARGRDENVRRYTPPQRRKVKSLFVSSRSAFTTLQSVTLLRAIFE